MHSKMSFFGYIKKMNYSSRGKEAVAKIRAHYVCPDLGSSLFVVVQKYWYIVSQMEQVDWKADRIKLVGKVRLT